MIQKSALRTTLLLAFLSMAPVAVPAPQNDDSTEQIACKLLEANMNAMDALDEVLGSQPVVQEHWPNIFSLYQQVFDKPDMPEASYANQMLAVANDLREKNGASFQQEIDALLDERHKDPADHLNARLFQTVVNGIQAHLVKVVLYYFNILTAENFAADTAHILHTWKERANQREGQRQKLSQEKFSQEEQAILDTPPSIYWEKLDEQYEQIFGPLTQNLPNNSSLGHLAQDAQQVDTLIAQKENDETKFLKKMIRVNQDLASKFHQSFLDTAKEHDAIKAQFTIVENPLRHLNMLFLTNALRCMKHQLSKTFGNNPAELLEKIAPKEDPKQISMPRAPASLQQNARPTTPQISPFSHPPVSTLQPQTPANWWQPAQPAAASPGPFDHNVKKATTTYNQLRARSRI